MAMKIKDEAQELKSLVGIVTPVIPTPSAEVAVDDVPEELEPEPIFEFNYKKEKKFFIKKARESIKRIVRTVIDDQTLIDKSFIADKIDQDAEQLGNLYYQYEKTEKMQESNMESVRTGNISPRMYETYNLMTKSLTDLSKQISDFQISVKDNYAKIKFDAMEEFAPFSQVEGEDTLKGLEATNVFRNSKELNLSMREKRKQLMLERADEKAKFEEVK